MSHPHSPPDDAAQVTENGFHFLDWTPSEKNSAENQHLFDGKIIARMPDLGSECSAKGDEKSRNRFHWGKIGSSISSSIQGPAFPTSATRSQLFHRITAFGCVVIFCGLILLLREPGDKSTENAPDITEIVVENVKIPITEFGGVGEVMVLAPAVQPEPTTRIPDFTAPPAIPVASAENLTMASVADTDQPNHVQSVWNRPTSDSYSPWHVTQRQPESPSAKVASLEPSQSSPQAQTIPSSTVAMVPMVDLSMPVSPYEQQLLAQSNPPPVQAPVDPFMQLNNHTGSGMMPTQNQWANAPEVAARPNDQRVPPPPYPQHLSPLAPQGMPTQHPYDQVPPPNVPIPSGISTLPSQGGGYYQQYPGGVASPIPSNSGSYYNVPPTYRRVY